MAQRRIHISGSLQTVLPFARCRFRFALKRVLPQASRIVWSLFLAVALTFPFHAHAQENDLAWLGYRPVKTPRSVPVRIRRLSHNLLEETAENELRQGISSLFGIEYPEEAGYALSQFVFCSFFQQVVAESSYADRHATRSLHGPVAEPGQVVLLGMGVEGECKCHGEEKTPYNSRGLGQHPFQREPKPAAREGQYGLQRS